MHVACPKEAVKSTCTYCHPYGGLQLKSEERNEEIVRMHIHARPDHMLSTRNTLQTEPENTARQH